MPQKRASARVPQKRNSSSGASPGRDTVFISWSGARSRRVAAVLKQRLPDVIQALTPWMSEQDIDAGELWSHAVDQNLGTNDSGILCLTPENLTAPWLLFEAGALSKHFGRSRVRPYLIGLKPSDVTGPLSRFQSVGLSRGDTKKLIESINRGMSTPLPEARLNSTFDLVWPQLERELAVAAASEEADEAAGPHRSPQDMLEEMLAILRAQERSRAEEPSQQAIQLLRRLVAPTKAENRRDAHAWRLLQAEDLLAIAHRWTAATGREPIRDPRKLTIVFGRTMRGAPASDETRQMRTRITR